MEYLARLDAVKKFAEFENVSMVYEEYDFAPYLKQLTKKTDDKKTRCAFCYLYRLTKTATYAKKNGFDGFTSTLLSSHNQQHEKICEIGKQLAQRYELRFYYEDFRKGVDQAKAITRQYGLYRQRYCGCLFSEWERYQKYESTFFPDDIRHKSQK
jgi:predicted adenine nucleotide alpha hydrolase (AANH) superfamily ATPase